MSEARLCYPCQEGRPDECWLWWLQTGEGLLLAHGPSQDPDDVVDDPGHRLCDNFEPRWDR